MLAHKLVLEDDDYCFKLIAIHCSAEEYKLAFLLNKHLDLRLSRTKEDHDYTSKNVKALFSVYKYENQQQYCQYYLISNKCSQEILQETNVNSLFPDDTLAASNTIHLLPDFRNVDYLLKIEEGYDGVSERELVEKIKDIPQVATAYSIATDQLKYKENLIFD